ncbi:putative Gonadotropin-releasing hormone [Prochlorococcus sp. MIT 0702]|nr:putative Gonadotropin-releasing hormone [Prochlorococcus sp. MIT 0701]KGG25993.1 putative Gonadotropin-releasing hormone [Prochlorococcus sp. MIT 0702]KGG30828.1 putative Gonadotropin-releasing hormone [Prochlorococcus sp. MIT 0703]
MRSILEDSKGDIGASGFNKQWLSENSNNKELEEIAKQWDAFLEEECDHVIEAQKSESIRLITSSLPVTVRNLEFAKQEKEQHWDWEISNGFIMLTCSEDDFNNTLKPYLESGQADYLDSNSGPLS